MRLSNEVANDRYLHNLARNVIGGMSITHEDFRATRDAFNFASRIHDRVYVWVTGNLIKPATLAKVISGAMGDSEEPSRAKGAERFTRLSEVTIRYRIGDHGMEILMQLATDVICTVIHDIFLMRDREIY